jgi:hypothetical protein
MPRLLATARREVSRELQAAGAQPQQLNLLRRDRRIDVTERWGHGDRVRVMTDRTDEVLRAVPMGRAVKALHSVDHLHAAPLLADSCVRAAQIYRPRFSCRENDRSVDELSARR